MTTSQPPAEDGDTPAAAASIDDAEFAQQMAAIAHAHVENSGQFFDEMTFDYSPASLQSVDQTMELYFPQGFTLDGVEASFAAYVGETLRRNHGGRWRYANDDTVGSVESIEGTAQVNPFQWVAERIDAIASGPKDENGRAGHLVAERYADLLRGLGREDAIPETQPVNFGRLREVQENLAELGELDRDDAVDLTLTPTQRRTLLDQAPALCFLLVAGVDGDIDKKEILSFAEALAGHAAGDNTLIRETFAAAPEKFAQHLTDIIAEVGPGAAMLIPFQIKTAMQIAREQHPADADGFAQALYDVAYTVADASGGFFGLGSKISTQEKTALEMLEVALGLKDEE